MKTKDKSVSEGTVHAGKPVWPIEVRLEVARAVVERDAGVARLADAFGISHDTVMDWVQRYRRLGAAGSSKGMGTRVLRQGDKGKPGGGQRRREAVTAAKREHPEHGSETDRAEPLDDAVTDDTSKDLSRLAWTSAGGALLCRGSVSERRPRRVRQGGAGGAGQTPLWVRLQALGQQQRGCHGQRVCCCHRLLERLRCGCTPGELVRSPCASCFRRGPSASG
jgi:transposase-like protein